jgi:hypothetical protein
MPTTLVVMGAEEVGLKLNLKISIGGIARDAKESAGAVDDLAMLQKIVSLICLLT